MNMIVKEKINFKKIKAFVHEYGWIVIIPFFLFGFYRLQVAQNDINKNTLENTGKVYSSTSIYKKYSKRNYKYEFYYNGERYTGSTSAYLSENVKIGNYYKVEFSSENPNHSRMLLDVPHKKERFNKNP